MKKEYQHKELAEGRWFQMSFFQQMANIGSEVERAILWKNKNKDYSIKAIERAFELLDLTISDKKNIKKLKELLRLKELLTDYFYSDNQYFSTDEFFRNYFYPFMYATRVNNL